MSGPRIVRARWYPFRVPFRSPFRTASGLVTTREGLFIELELGSGVIGVGEASPLPHYTGGSLAEALDVAPGVLRSVIGMEATDAWRAAVAPAHVSRGTASALACGIETALADALSAEAGVPLFRWLASETGLPASPRVRVNATIDATEPATAAVQAMEYAAAGFSTLKLKVGNTDDEDVARIRAVREAVGTAVELRIDANGAWDEERAIRMLGRLEPLGIALCEQPTAAGAGSVERLARVRTLANVPIAPDESCRSVEDLRAILAAGAADAVALKPMASGLRQSLEMLALARQASLPVIVTTMFDAGIGTALAVHLAAVTGPGGPACGLATLDLLESPLATGVPAIEHGSISLTEAPGLGARVDDAALDRHAAGPGGEC